ncbi:MAG: hypothetical protein NC489_42155 [Ruminococcus flavefaciens]|nr:hypothetical protein [Ruminococcus flavefaciens]
MGWVHIQMIDNSVSSDWWKKIIPYFIKVGDKLEIYCWKEETTEIQQASLYGDPMENKYEVSIKGTVTFQLLAELLTEEPIDKNIYNKMTKYFTINIKNRSHIFSSEHYGTEIFVNGTSDDIAFILNAIEPYGDSFSVDMGE